MFLFGKCAHTSMVTLTQLVLGHVTDVNMDAQLAYGCPAGCGGAIERDPALLVAYVLGKREAMEPTIVQWLRFAHYGCVDETTPAVWVLALMGTPCSSVIVEALRGCTALECLRAGGRSAAVQAWARDMSDAVSTWPCMADRDDLFAALREWLRSGWKARYSDSGLKYLTGVAATAETVRLLVDAEGVLGWRLPPDIRRVILECGDVGKAVFGTALLPFNHERVRAGRWQWANKVRYSAADECVFGGSWYIGCGGGGYASSLHWVMETSELWIHDIPWEHDDYCTLKRFKKEPGRPGSALLQAMLFNVWFPKRE